MKKLAHWAPAPNLTILTVERDETNWAVSQTDSGESFDLHIGQEQASPDWPLHASRIEFAIRMATIAS